MDPLVVLFGLGVGVLVGTTGIGGGSLMTPLLILVLGTKPTIAIGTDLAYAAVTKTVGGWRHLRKGNVDLPLALWMTVGSVPAALGGVWTLSKLEEALGGGSYETTILTLVACALLLSAVAVIGRALFRPVPERDTVDMRQRHRIGAALLGLCVGFVLGLTSAGSGALIALGLILFFRLTPLRVVGTDVFHAAVLLWVAAFAHLVSGNVDLFLAANILIGSIPGVWLGVSLANRMPENGLRPALGVVLLAAGLALLNKAGADFPLVLVFVLPLLVGVVVVMLHRSRPSVQDPAPATPAAPQLS